MCVHLTLPPGTQPSPRGDTGQQAGHHRVGVGREGPGVQGVAGEVWPPENPSREAEGPHEDTASPQHSLHCPIRPHKTPTQGQNDYEL